MADDLVNLPRNCGTSCEVAARWVDELGPMYDEDTVDELLGGDTVPHDEAAQGHRLLALVTGSGQVVYPAFQFTSHGGVVAGLGDVLQVLDAVGVSKWTVASWLVSPAGELGGKTPMAALADGGGGAVINAAQLWAAANR